MTSPEPEATRATWSGETPGPAFTQKPVSLLKRKTESSIVLGGDTGAGATARVAMRHRNRGRELTVSSSRSNLSNTYEEPTAPRLSMPAAGGGSREEVAKRRPQRYNKIKMKTSPTSTNGKHATVADNNSKKAGGFNRQGAAGIDDQERIGIRPIAIKLKTAGAAFGALAVARKVASGFRGDPDWASRASRSAGRR